MKKRNIIILVVLCIIIIAVVIGLSMINKDKKPNEGNPTPIGNAGETNPPEGENNISQEQSKQVSDYVTEREGGVQTNTSGKMQETKTFKGLEINNINLETLGDKTVMLADVKNTNKSKVEEREIKVDLLSEDGKTIITLKGKIDAIEPEAITQLNIEVEGNHVDAYDYRIYE